MWVIYRSWNTPSLFSLFGLESLSPTPPPFHPPSFINCSHLETTSEPPSLPTGVLMQNYPPGEEFEGVLTSENFIFRDRGGSLSSMSWTVVPVSLTSTTDLPPSSAPPVDTILILSSNMKISPLRNRSSSSSSEHHVGDIICELWTIKFSV